MCKIWKKSIFQLLPPNARWLLKVALNTIYVFFGSKIGDTLNIICSQSDIFLFLLGRQLSIHGSDHSSLDQPTASATAWEEDDENRYQEVPADSDQEIDDDTVKFVADQVPFLKHII